MGNSVTRRVSFEDVEYAQKGHALLISVLAENEQSVLIQGTVPLESEVEEVEHAIASKRAIIIYGKNANDEKVYVKYDQVIKLGGRPYIYSGGMFEWLLLQEVFGDRIQTTAHTLDILKYRPFNILNTKYLLNHGGRIA